VVAVRVCYDRAVYGQPRIDVEVPGFAVESAFGGAKKIGHSWKFKGLKINVITTIVITSPFREGT
jgi:hypothetical protein